MARCRRLMTPHGLSVALRRGRRCHLESLEPRRLMAGDVAPQVLLGSVYFEEATGDDSQPDVIQVSFEGGAAGTTLNRLVIDGDKRRRRALDRRRVLRHRRRRSRRVWRCRAFDPQPQWFHGQQRHGRRRRHANRVHVQRLRRGREVRVLARCGRGAIRRRQRHVDTNSLVEGAEFQRSNMIGKFSAPHFVDLTLNGQFLRRVRRQLLGRPDRHRPDARLPKTRIRPTHDFTDRTAGAVAYAAQIPLATISGWVYHDRSDDGSFDTARRRGHRRRHARAA